MRKWFRKGVATLCTVTVALSGVYFMGAATQKDVKAEDKYKLVWFDEFEGNSLDRNVWSFDIGNGQGGWGNGESEYYTDREQNIKVEDGFLKIKAIKENYNGYKYTSGRIKSIGTKYFKYGKMEAKIKVENGNQSGVWPAFWMMGENLNDGINWPNCGEIDIMEHANANNYVLGTLHWNYNGLYGAWNAHGSYGSGNENQNYVFSDNENHGINDWHVYGLIWDENHMEWTVDGKTYFQQNITDNNAYCFQKEFYFLFNLAIGGQFTGWQMPPEDYRQAEMYVDYVRVYQEPGSQEETTTEGMDTSGEYVDSVAENKGVFDSYYGEEAWANASGTAKDASNTGITLNINKIGHAQWGVQASLKNLTYISGNTYKYNCTISSDKTKNVYVKVVGDNDSYIFYGKMVKVEANKPYNFETYVKIPNNYKGRLDLYFGLGLQGTESVRESDSANITISDASFVTYKKPEETTTNGDTQPDITTKGDTQPDITTGGNNDIVTTVQESSISVDNSNKAPAKAVIKKVKKKNASKKLSIKLKKLKGVTGYQVAVSKVKKFAKKKTVTKNYKKNNVSFKTTFRKLKGAKKYYVRARAYKKLKGKKVYGKWSRIKKVKIK